MEVVIPVRGMLLGLNWGLGDDNQDIQGTFGKWNQ